MDYSGGPTPGSATACSQCGPNILMVSDVLWKALTDSDTALMADSSTVCQSLLLHVLSLLRVCKITSYISIIIKLKGDWLN